MAKKVTIYSTPACHYCHQAKEFFTEHGVKFTDYNVQLDHARAEEMIKITGQTGVPVIVIADEDGSDEQAIIGFDRRGVSRLLGI